MLVLSGKVTDIYQNVKLNWFFSCSYNADKINIEFRLKTLRKTLESLTRCYENMIVMGDFNVELNKANMQNFLNLYNIKNLIKEKN